MLSKFFSPSSIALIGASATPEKLGFSLLANLVNSEYAGKVFPVNPKATEILGKEVFSNVSQIPGSVDLALIAVPAEAVLKVLEECGQKGIRHIVIISAGFKESGAEGSRREQKIQETIARYHLQLIGPNCLGILNPHSALNASFAEGMPRPGNIGLVSQSGAMIVAIADWATEENLGFSKIVSLGNKAGLTENELLEYLGNDPETEVILLYLESFADGRKFMELGRRIARKKPLIIFKAGNSEAGAKAVSSHTGSLAGSNTAALTALRQCGAIHAKTLEDFFDYARIFSMQPLPQGNRVTIVTNAGGPGVIATDAVAASPLLTLTKFSAETNAKLQEVLPATAHGENPVDVIGDALADRYDTALAAILSSSETDMLITILTPQIMTEKEQTVKILHQFANTYPQKTFVTSFMGGRNIAYAEAKLAEYRIPNFLSPNRAVECLEQMVWLQQWRNKTPDSKLPTPNSRLPRGDAKIVAALRKKIAAERRPEQKQLSTALVYELLEAFGIATAIPKLARTEAEALRIAEEIGYPVVLKIAAAEILHKTDAGGVRLALKNEEEVRRAFAEIWNNIAAKFPEIIPDGILVQKMHHFGRETIVGVKRDAVFGPLIMFGLGGIYVEVLKDVSFRVAPVDRREAVEMIREVKAIKLLEGVRGEAGADIEALTETILAVSELALAFPEIAELDLNPLLVRSEGQGVVALDARMLF